MNNAQINNRDELENSLLLAIKEGNCHNLKELLDYYDFLIDIPMLLELIMIRKLTKNKKIYHLISRKTLQEINCVLEKRSIN